MSNVIVAKFGGTSMADAVTMRRCANIIKDRNEIRLVVVSATSGTTNKLIEIAEYSNKGNWENAKSLINKIIEKHNNIASELEMDDDSKRLLEPIYDEIKTISKGIYYLGEISPKAESSLLSCGERLSANLFKCALNNTFGRDEFKNLNARDYIVTESNAGSNEPVIKLIKERVESNLKSYIKSNRFVTEGFIAKNKNGENSTLGRGGSDYTATLFAEALEGHEVQIWTDVDGIATTDPRIVKNAGWIDEISYSEAAELANSGAKVLHPQTLLPAMRADIPVFVGNSLEPDSKGTIIKHNTEEKPLIRALALKKNQTILTVSSLRMVEAYGFLERIFSVFSKYKLSIDLITTSETSISLTLDDPSLLSEDIIDELKEHAEVMTENNLSLVSLVGNDILTTPGIASKTFSALKDKNIRMICYGASKYNLAFLIDKEYGEEAIKRIHRIFLEI